MRTVLIRLVTIVGLFAVWGTLAITVLTGSIRESPFAWNHHDRITLMQIMPEGWAFFTRNPREPVTKIYRQRSGTWTYVDRANFSPRSWFGAKRTSTLESIELQNLLGGIYSDSTWTECTEDVSTCVASASPETVALENTSRTQLLCGSLLVQKHDPVPWAWAQNEDDVVMPSRIVHLSIECSDTA